MTDWSKYSKAGNSCTNNLWTVPEWATTTDPQTSSSQSDLSSQSGSSPFDLYKQPGKETPICWDTRRLGTETLFAESAPVLHPERPLFQCQIIPGNVKPSDLATLFYVTLGGLGVARVYSRHVRDILKEGSQEIAYRVYELKERFKSGNELSFEVQVDSSGNTTLIGQARFIDHSNNDKFTQYEIRKPDSSKNWHLEVAFPDGKLTQNFIIEYPQGLDQPGRVRLSIPRDQPTQAFVVNGTTKFRIASTRFLPTDPTQAQPTKPVTIEYLEPKISLKENQGTGSYQIAHLSNGDVATIFISDDLTQLSGKGSYIHRFPTERDKEASYFPLRPDVYASASTTARYSPLQPYPFEFVIESRTVGGQTVRQFQLMPNFANLDLLTLNQSGAITKQKAQKGIRLQPTSVTALFLAEGGNQTLIGEFTGEIFGLTIDANHPLQIQGELQDGVFRPTFPNGQPQQQQAVVYNADGHSFSAPLMVELHPDEELGYRLTVTYSSGKNGDPEIPIDATPYSNGNLFAIATPNQRSAAEKSLADLATEVGYTLPNQTNGGTTIPAVNLALLQAEMGKRQGNGVSRSFFSVTVADADANITRSDGINFSYHGKISVNSGGSEADFFRVDLGGGKRLELAGTLDESGEKFTPYLVRYFATADDEPRVITTTQTDAGALRLDNFDKLYQSMEIFPAALSHLVHKTGTREEAQGKILFKERPFARPQAQPKPPAAPAAPTAPPAPARATEALSAVAATESASTIVTRGVTVPEGGTRRTAQIVLPAALGTPASLLPSSAESGGFIVSGTRGRGMGALPKARPAPALSVAPAQTAQPLMSMVGEVESPPTLPICEPAALSAPAAPPPAATPAPITPIVHPTSDSLEDGVEVFRGEVSLKIRYGESISLTDKQQTSLLASIQRLPNEKDSLSGIDPTADETAVDQARTKFYLEGYVQRVYLIFEKLVADGALEAAVFNKEFLPLFHQVEKHILIDEVTTSRFPPLSEATCELPVAPDSSSVQATTSSPLSFRSVKVTGFKMIKEGEELNDKLIDTFELSLSNGSSVQVRLARKKEKAGHPEVRSPGYQAVEANLLAPQGTYGLVIESEGNDFIIYLEQPGTNLPPSGKAVVLPRPLLTKAAHKQKITAEDLDSFKVRNVSATVSAVVVYEDNESKTGRTTLKLKSVDSTKEPGRVEDTFILKLNSGDEQEEIEIALSRKGGEPISRKYRAVSATVKRSNLIDNGAVDNIRIDGSSQVILALKDKRTVIVHPYLLKMAAQTPGEKSPHKLVIISYDEEYSAPTYSEPEERQMDEPSEDPPVISEDRPFDSAAIRLETIQRVAEEFQIDPATLWDTEAAFPRGMNLRVLSGEERHRVYGRTGSLLKIEFDLPRHGSFAELVTTLKVTYDGQEIPFRYSIDHNRPYILLEGPLQGTVFYFKKPTHSIYNIVEATHPIIREQAERDMGHTPPARPSKNIQFTYPEVRENFLSLSPKERTKFENKMADQIQRNREQVASSKGAGESRPDQKTTGRLVEAVGVSGRTAVELDSPPSSPHDPLEVLKDFVRRVAGLRNLPISELSARILAGITGTPAAETSTESAALSPALACEVPPPAEIQSGVVAEAQAAPLVCEETPPPAVTQRGVADEPSTPAPSAPLVCEEAASSAEARRETPTTFSEGLHQEIEKHQRHGGDPIDNTHIQKLLSLMNDQSDDPILKGWIGAIEETYKNTPETRNIILHKILSLYGRPETNIEERSSIEQLVLAGLDEVYVSKAVQDKELEFLRPSAVKKEREAREAMKRKKVEEAQNAFREDLRQEMANIPESSEHAILESHIQRAISLIKGHPYDPALKGWVLAIENAYETFPQVRNDILREVFSLYAQSERKPEESSVERLVLGGLSKVYKQERVQTAHLDRLRKDAIEREKEAREDMERKMEEMLHTGK